MLEHVKNRMNFLAGATHTVTKGHYKVSKLTCHIVNNTESDPLNVVMGRSFFLLKTMV